MQPSPLRPYDPYRREQVDGSVEQAPPPFFLTVQISERLRQHGLVDRVLRRAGFEPYAQSLRHCGHRPSRGLASPPGQLKTSCPFITAVAEPVLLVRHARIGSAVQRATSRINPSAGHTSHIHSGRAARVREVDQRWGR